MNRAPSQLPTVFMFSGQGSQYYQMGRALYDHVEPFRVQLDDLDGHVRRHHNFSCIKTLYDGQHPLTAPFNDLVQTHPSIFMLQYALARAAMNAGLEPDYVLGASLGEYCALSVAGCLPPDRMLSLIIEQARHIEHSCDKAAMLTVLADVSLYKTEAFLYSQSQLAAMNFPGHFTVAGGLEAIDDIEYELQRREIDHQRLTVSYAFHSEWIDSAAPEITARLSGVEPASPRARFISCAAAGEMVEIAGTHLWDAAREPIRFQQTIDYLEARGAYHYVDFSPSGTLGTFAKYCLDDAGGSTISQTFTPYGDDRRNVRRLLGLPPTEGFRPPRHSTA